MKSLISSGKPKRLNVRLRRVVGQSMQPTLQPGQIVVISSKQPVKVGDIIVLKHGGVEKIKRVARMDEGRVYVLGDNPTASIDSRSFGWLGIETVRGKVIWPRHPSSVQTI